MTIRDDKRSKNVTMVTICDENDDTCENNDPLKLTEKELKLRN